MGGGAVGGDGLLGGGQLEPRPRESWPLGQGEGGVSDGHRGAVWVPTQCSQGAPMGKALHAKLNTWL